MVDGGVGSGVPAGPLDSGRAVFVADLRTSARILGSVPLLVLLTLLLATPAPRAGGATILDLPRLVLTAGFVGTQRVWFRRVYDGGDLRRDEIWPVTVSMLGRFLALGLLLTAISVPFATLGLLVAGSTHRTTAGALVVYAAFGLLADVALTFVVPALALTTNSVGDAWHGGLALLRSTWPGSAWYALAPGLTLVVVAQALGAGSSSYATRAIAAFIAALLALWFKGAIVAFYLRATATEPTAPA